MALTTIKSVNSTTKNANIGNLTYTGGLFSSNVPIVLNDISTQFDGTKSVFNLVQDQTTINTIVDSKDLEVVINGQRLTPYVAQATYPWLTPYDSFNGFRVKNVPDETTGLTTVGKVIIYNTPYIGDNSSLLLRQVTTTAQVTKYPFTATTIALGD